jgi:beta-glucuronidase
MNAGMLYPRRTLSREAVSLDGMWRFSFAGSVEGLDKPILMPVPSSFQDLFTEKELRDYTGDCWYETEVFIPEGWRGKQVSIRFGCATHRAAVYLNGGEVARHEGGFTPFCADITGARYGESNRLTVCVNNALSEVSLPAGKGGTPYFDFFNYSGLQRSVWLVCTPVEAITDFSVVHRLTEAGAEVDYKITATGDGDAELLVYDEDGKPVANAAGKEGTVLIPDARLWQVRDAYLYRFVIRYYQDGKLIDEWYDHIGIRTVSISGYDFLINGKPVYLKGFGKHEDSDIIGRGTSLPVLKRDFELLKWIGANSLRTSHYPYSEEFYQMADREGFLVIDEVSAVGFMLGFAFVRSPGAGQLTFFEKETTPQLLENHVAAVRELISRDKNHACVIAWSLFNEPQTTHPSAVKYFERVFNEALVADPQKRPRTFAMERSSDYATCQCYQLCDFISLNRYYGWYIQGGSQIGEAEKSFRQELDGWRDAGIDRPVVFTEYGADTDGHLHKLPSTMWSQEYQFEMITMNHRVFDDYPFVRGEQVWNFADFQTGEGFIRVDGNKKGVFTRQRQPKAVAFMLKERWESLPVSFKTL